PRIRRILAEADCCSLCSPSVRQSPGDAHRQPRSASAPRTTGAVAPAPDERPATPVSNSPPPPYRRISPTAPGGPQRAPYPTFPPPSSFAARPPAPARRRPVGLIVTASILGLLLLIAGGVAVSALLQNAAANATIREQRQQLEEQERELEEQREL